MIARVRSIKPSGLWAEAVLANLRIEVQAAFPAASLATIGMLLDASKLPGVECIRGR